MCRSVLLTGAICDLSLPHMVDLYDASPAGGVKHGNVDDIVLLLTGRLVQ